MHQIGIRKHNLKKTRTTFHFAASYDDLLERPCYLLSTMFQCRMNIACWDIVIVEGPLFQELRSTSLDRWGNHNLDYVSGSYFTRTIRKPPT